MVSQAFMCSCFGCSWHRFADRFGRKASFYIAYIWLMVVSHAILGKHI